MLKVILFFCLLSSSLLCAKPPVFVGIAGGTGSGKTTFAERIHEAFPESILISQDSYYKDLSHLTYAERAKMNFDHPNSLDFALLRQQLMDLKEGRAIERPIYSFCEHARIQATERIEPAQIVVVEGILLLAVPEIRELFDIKIFVDADDDIYNENIQIAELNSLNACLAVIKWKKYIGFYQDKNHENFTYYSTNDHNFLENDHCA